ncbi:hypothetical protein P3T76_012452 [Phytophthora citrophthora]|uniref:Uncharacterized protein n=1 Tax=Phytophthora citrophthora TaxID=4793 RepID=A0AAD9G4P7_9STRA|nr:hypothetical protein P3T76_012452 [Phytophthora citrophthora]
MAWTSSKIGRNVRVGFNAYGMFPLSLVRMHERLELYERNGAPRHVHLASWLQVKPTIEAEVLTLRVKPKKTTERKRVAVGGRLLTHEALQELAEAGSKNPSRLRKLLLQLQVKV